MDKNDLANLIDAFLAGTCGDWDWDDFMSVTQKNHEVEKVRKQLQLLPVNYPPTQKKQYCNEKGIEVLREVAIQLRTVQSLRPDLRAIADMVAPSSTLLDVGCGEGDLLLWLQKEKQVSGRGIELSQGGVNHCIAKGLSVIQGDADIDLAYYPDKAYDYVVLSQTLQTLREPKEVLKHLVRISRHAVVSVPNFGHWKNRLYLLCNGQMPVTKNLSYQWYDTPNIHFCTISDFIKLCESLSLKVEKSLYITESGATSSVNSHAKFANIFGQNGIFMVTG